MRSLFLKGLVLTAFLGVLLIVFNSKSVTLSKEDEAFIKTLSGEWRLPDNTDSIHASFKNEIAFVTALQNNVLQEIAHKEIPLEYFGDLHFYFTEKKGYCYDRAVLLEKFLKYNGFSFRHLYLYFGEENQTPAFSSLFKKGLASHALLEVKTKKGWMVIGTNANWIGLSDKEEVLDVAQLRKRINQNNLVLRTGATVGTCFWKEKGGHFRYLYGVYSRHGQFFSHPKGGESASLFSIHFLPDYNFSMLLDNI